MLNSEKLPVKIALVSDILTRECLAPECELVDIPSRGFRRMLADARPDMLLVESAWHGIADSWRFRIASYPGHLWRNTRRLRKLVACARDMGIPTVFWNKEDRVHFHRFIDVARLFDHVLTVDAGCVERYREVMGADASVGVLPFPVQPRIHHFKGFDFKHHTADFVGSYSHHIHDGRREWQDMAFGAALSTGLGLTVFDRNSNRASGIYRYPEQPGMVVRPAVSQAGTAQIYRDYLVSLNVNTVRDSQTMYSRRLVEILACGGIAVTSPAHSVDALFSDYCHVVGTGEEAAELFDRLKHGPDARDLERARAGAEHVAAHHSWRQGLERILSVAGL